MPDDQRDQTPGGANASLGQSKPDSKAMRRRLAGLVVASLLIGSALALAGLSLIPPAQKDLGPAVVSADASVGTGQTVVQVPLFGTISAKTHSAPLSIQVAIQEINLKDVGKGLDSPQGRNELARLLEGGMKGLARSLGLRLIVGAAVIGAVGAALVPGRRALSISVGGLGGLLAVGSLLGLTARGFDVQSFQEPRFSGAIERAPAIIQAVQRRSGSIDDLKSRFHVGADRLTQILSLASQPIGDPGNDSVAILHISDIHSNPLGLELAKQMAANFKVDAILDTGDLTSFGEPIEARIGQLLAGPVPYLFVPGNHDSDANRAALAGVAGVSLLHDAVIDVKGVKIMGWADPTFTAKNGISPDEGKQAIKKEAVAVAARVKDLQPDVLAVHNPELAAGSYGETPLIVAGHGHRKRDKKAKDTLMLQVGSTGATGLGSFLVEADHDYEAEVIYFNEGVARAVDYIRFRALGADFDIERRTLQASSAT